MKDGKSEAILGVLWEQTGKDSCPSLREAQAEVSLEMPLIGKHVWMTEVRVTGEQEGDIAKAPGYHHV